MWKRRVWLFVFIKTQNSLIIDQQRVDNRLDSNILTSDVPEEPTESPTEKQHCHRKRSLL